MYRKILYPLFFLLILTGFLDRAYARASKNYLQAQPITICSAAPIVIQGDLEIPVPSAYLWQVLKDSVWVNAPGVNTSEDYTASSLVNSTNANIVFSIRRQITVSGSISYDSFYDVTILPSAPVTSNQITAPAITSFCITGAPGIITGTTAAGGDGTVSYQWQKSTDNVNFTNITGATAASYTPPTLTVTTYYRRMASAGSCVATSTSNTVAINIIQVAAGNSITAPAISSFCTSSNPTAIIGSTPTSGDGTYVYQWQSSATNSNFTDIAGANSKDYTPPTATTTMYYLRLVSSGPCSTAILSNVITISVLPSLTNNLITAPATTSYCVSGDPTLITGNIPTGGNGNYVYQWQQSTDNVNFTDIIGATANGFDPPIITTSTYYRRTVTSGQCTTPAISNVVFINILPFPGNPIPSLSTVTVCPGSMATLSISNPQVGLIYNWYDSATRTTLLFTGTTFITPALTVSTTYYVESNNGVCSGSPLSTVQVSVVNPAAITNNVITQPAIHDFCTPGDATVITGNTPSGGDGVNYAYQWQSSTDNVNFTNISGANGISYDPPLVSVTTYFRRSVTSGNCVVPFFSNSVPIAILPAIANNVITAPIITSFCTSGDPAVITGNTPSGGNGIYTYQWQQSTDNVTFTDIAGANAINYDPSVISTSTYYRRTVIAGQCTVPILSNTITIIIVPLPGTPVPSQAAVTVCPGSQATFSVSAPQSGLIYNWYDSSAKTNLLFTGTIYTTAPQTVAATYYIESTNGSCANPVLASVQVNIAPQPVTPTLASTIVSTCTNSTATLSVSNPQTGITYNWYQAVSGGPVLFTGTTFTTPVLSANTVYYVEAVNPSGCTAPVRSAADVTILPLPVVAAQNASTCVGSSISLTATANVPSATFNWYTTATGGIPVFTGNTYTIAVLNNDANFYVEAINNATGCISAARQLVTATVAQPLAAPVVTLTGTTMNSVSFSWNAVPNATGYQVSTDNGVTYTSPSSGSNGLTHTVSGLPENAVVTLIVRAIGSSVCQLSPPSAPVTGKAQGQGDEIYVANAFTPNGDGVNDVIYVHSEGIKTFTFYVYDQWGEMLFNSTSLATGWDGTFKGKREPAGVYIYYLKADMNNGHSLNKKGTITLLR